MKNIRQTRQLAEELACRGKARIYALTGELGSGKTTFVQAFLKALGVKGRITSPTFVLVKKYELKHLRHCESRPRAGAGRSNLVVIASRSEAISSSDTGIASPAAGGLAMTDGASSLRAPAGRSNLFVYHIDAYRLEKPKELVDLGFKKIIADPKNIVLIEWADRVKRLIPKNAVWIRFEHGSKKNEREVTIKHKT